MRVFDASPSGTAAQTGRLVDARPAGPAFDGRPCGTAAQPGRGFDGRPAGTADTAGTAAQSDAKGDAPEGETRAS